MVFADAKASHEIVSTARSDIGYKFLGAVVLLVVYRTLKQSDPSSNIALTERDVLWIRAVHRFRFITTDQAVWLSGTSSRSAINRRLRLLNDHGYLERPTVQREAFAYKPKRHTVHALGQRGAKWLAENDGVEFPKGKGWHTANQLKSAERLIHQIGVVDTMLHFERAVGERDDLTLSHQDEVIAGLDWPNNLKHFRLPTRAEYQGVMIDRATDPDYTLVLTKEKEGKRGHSLCFLEWDNNSEDFVKANQLASSIAQKHRCYADAYERKLHTKLYGFKVFRVLFVVNDDQSRIVKMRRVCDRVVTEGAKRLFWYTTADQLAKEGPLADIWVTGDGTRQALV